MKSFTNSRKFLFGVSVSMVLAMAVGSFALGESQTPASPQAVGATAGPFTVIGGTQGTDYDYASPVLTIHSGNLTVSTTAQTAERIVVDGASTITLEGVNISATAGPALQIQDNATFNVNILLADGSTNILKGKVGTDLSNPGSPGIQKNGKGDNIGTLTIGVPDSSQGTGTLEATGGQHAAGIGGGDYGNGSKITIGGGEVTSNGGYAAAGIGGGWYGSGSDITITSGVVHSKGGINGAGIGGGSNVVDSSDATEGSKITINGGEVTAYGGTNAAGIGGGNNGDGNNIIITGGEVTAYGGKWGAGIGGGYNKSGNGNSLNGDAVVLATSGITTKAALEGFVNDQQESLLTQGIAFTGLGTAFDSDGHATDVSWDESGTMYGDSVTTSQNVEFPADLTIGTNQSNPQELIVDTNVTLTISAGATLQNEGILTVNGTVECLYDQEAGTTGEVTTALTYDAQDGRIANADEYKTYQDSNEVKAYSELPNAEKDGCIFEGWYTERDGEGTKVEETSLVLLNQHVLYANWTSNPEPIPDPSVDPDQGGDGSDASSKTGDSFAGIAALAILGVATTGAALLRKRK